MLKPILFLLFLSSSLLGQTLAGEWQLYKGFYKLFTFWIILCFYVRFNMRSRLFLFLENNHQIINFFIFKKLSLLHVYQYILSLYCHWLSIFNINILLNLDRLLLHSMKSLDWSYLSFRVVIESIFLFQRKHNKTSHKHLVRYIWKTMGEDPHDINLKEKKMTEKKWFNKVKTKTPLLWLHNSTTCIFKRNYIFQKKKNGKSTQIWAS